MNAFEKALVDGVRNMPDEDLIEAIRTKIGMALGLIEPPAAETRSPQEMRQVVLDIVDRQPKKRRRRAKKKAVKEAPKPKFELGGSVDLFGISHTNVRAGDKHFFLWQVKDQWFLQDVRSRKAKKKAMVKIEGKSRKEVLKKLEEHLG
jgi:hypothetical protein